MNLKIYGPALPVLCHHETHGHVSHDPRREHDAVEHRGRHDRGQGKASGAQLASKEQFKVARVTQIRVPTKGL